MPNFTWNVSPVAFAIPKMALAIGLAVIGALTIVGGLQRKAKDSLGVGALFVGAAALVYTFVSKSFDIRWYSLIFVLVFAGGYALLNWQIKRGGGDQEEAGDFIVYGVLGVLIGARLGHVLFYDLDKALRDPMWVFAIWTGGLASHGAVMGLITAMWLFTKRRGVPFLEGSDRFAFSAALGAMLVRIGNFFNSEIVGIKTNQTWGVRFPQFDKNVDPLDAPLRYPTQLYEAGIGLFVLIALYFFDRALGKERRPRGAMISLFFALYFPLRFVVEFWKEHQVFKDTTLDMGHYLSIPGALLGLYGLWWSFHNRLPVGWTPERRGEHEYEEEYDEEYEEEEYDEEEEYEGEEAEEEYEGDEGGADEGELEDEEEEEERARRRAKKKKKKKKKKQKKKSKQRRLERDADVDEEFETGEMARRRRLRESENEADRAPADSEPKEKKKKKQPEG